MTEQRLPRDVIQSLLMDPAFSLCLEQCLDEPELVSNFCRLYDVSLPRQPRNGLEAMVDKVTGYRQDTYNSFFVEFIPFVHRWVYSPLKSDFELMISQFEPAKQGEGQ